MSLPVVPLPNPWSAIVTRIGERRFPWVQLLRRRALDSYVSVSEPFLFDRFSYDPVMRPSALAIPLALLLLAGCGGGDASEDSPMSSAPMSEQATADVVEVPEASELQVSGDFEADLTEYTGIEPDDVDDFREYIAEGLCETDIDPEAVGPEAFSVMAKRYGDDSPETGTHPDLVRLVVAYDCPDRVELAEQYLAEVEA